MRRIYKYPVSVTDDFMLDMPAGAKVLSVQVQNGEPHLWALVETDGVMHERRTFHLYGTGNPLPRDVGSFVFVGTFQLRGGALVFHLFEEP